MPAPTVTSFARLAALGAFGVAAGCVAGYAVLVWASLPTPTGGIDRAHALITRVSIGVIMAAVAAVHVVYARQLWAAARRQR